MRLIQRSFIKKKYFKTEKEYLFLVFVIGGLWDYSCFLSHQSGIIIIVDKEGGFRLTHTQIDVWYDLVYDKRAGQAWQAPGTRKTLNNWGKFDGCRKLKKSSWTPELDSGIWDIYCGWHKPLYLNNLYLIGKNG